jgi:DNA (cytosine-5)-methyltransferase 1
MAGWRIAAAVEYDTQIADTYRFNRVCEHEPTTDPDATLFLQSDLSDERMRLNVIDAIRRKHGNEICATILGWQPCQRFSHEGCRSKDDLRNNLAGVFLQMVEALQPQIVVLENVEGLLTFNKGQVLIELQGALSALGYKLGSKPWLLSAEQYGVPQMRRRVFLVAAKDIIPTPPNPIFRLCRGRRESDNSLKLFPDLPAPITVGEALVDLPMLIKARQLLSDEESPREPINGERNYSLWLKGLMSVEGMLEAASNRRSL